MLETYTCYQLTSSHSFSWICTSGDWDGIEWGRVRLGRHWDNDRSRHSGGRYVTGMFYAWNLAIDSIMNNNFWKIICS